MRNNNTGCLTAFVSGFSRIVLLMFWIARPLQWEAAFSTAIWPCLGWLFLPFTTLIYAWLVQGPGHTLQGLDWLWLILAVLIDLAGIAAAGYSNRNRLPASVPGSTAPPTAPPTTPQ